jgi:hypothetical protein
MRQFGDSAIGVRDNERLAMDAQRFTHQRHNCVSKNGGLMGLARRWCIAMVRQLR